MINWKSFKELIYYSLLKIQEKESLLNGMNVFPVADGDTGRNVFTTLKNAYETIKDSSFKSLKEITNEFSKSLLHSCRGNAGNILSEYFRGFNAAVNPEVKELNTAQLIQCLQNGAQYAYQAVSKPQEGTMITVMRAASEISFDSSDIAKEMYSNGLNSLIESRLKLPILSETGIVDSGGYAFVFILETLYLLFSKETEKEKQELIQEQQKKVSIYTSGHNLQFEEWKKQSIESEKSEKEVFYCCEFLYESLLESSVIKKSLEGFGDSLVLINDEKINKIHIHSQTPLKMFSLLEKNGKILNVKVDNMSFQHHEFLQNEDIKEQYHENKTGLLVIASTKESGEIINSIGTSRSLYRPQFLDLLSELSFIESSDILILSNEPELAPDILKAIEYSSKNCRLIEIENIAQSIHFAVQFNQDLEIDENEKNLNQLNKKVCYEIVPNANSIDIENLIKSLKNKIHLITLFSGFNLTEKQELKIADDLKKSFNSIEIEILRTHQKDCDLILSFE